MQFCVQILLKYCTTCTTYTYWAIVPIPANIAHFCPQYWNHDDSVADECSRGHPGLSPSPSKPAVSSLDSDLTEAGQGSITVVAGLVTARLWESCQ